jgi:hypothetical protein
MSSGDVPKPSKEEKQLQRAQVELLNQQRQMIEQQRQQNLILAPFFAKQEGFDVTVDPSTGQITSIREIDTPERRREAEIRGLFQERSLKALKGELPVDPALERSLKEQETELRNRLTQQFGPGYETTTPGIQTLGEFFRSAEELRSGARTGQLTLAEQLGLTREQQEMFRRGTAQDVTRQFGIADPMTFAGALGQVSKGYALPQQFLMAQRQFAAQTAQSKKAQIGAGIGALGGAAVGAYFGGPQGAAAGAQAGAYGGGQIGSYF